MTLVLQLLPAFAAGASLGVLFFYGLWITIKNIDQARNPAARMLGSMLLRLSVVLTGFYSVGYYTGFTGLLAAASGFMLARLLIVSRIAPIVPSRLNRGVNS